MTVKVAEASRPAGQCVTPEIFSPCFAEPLYGRLKMSYHCAVFVYRLHYVNAAIYLNINALHHCLVYACLLKTVISSYEKTN